MHYRKIRKRWRTRSGLCWLNRITFKSNRKFQESHMKLVREDELCTSPNRKIGGTKHQSKGNIKIRPLQIVNLPHNYLSRYPLEISSNLHLVRVPGYRFPHIQFPQVLIQSSLDQSKHDLCRKCLPPNKKT